MATLLVVDSNPDTFPTGAWSETDFNSGIFRFSFTFGSAIHTEWGALVCGEIIGGTSGGLWATTSGGTGKSIELYDCSPAEALLFAGQVQWTAGTQATITVNTPASQIILEGFTAGNGTFSLTGPGPYFHSGGALAVGTVAGAGGFNISGVFSNFDDTNTASPASGSAAGTSTTAAVGLALVRSVGASANTSTASGVSSLPVGSVTGVATVQGVGAVLSRATGASTNTSLMRAFVPGLSVAQGVVRQKLLNDPNPPTTLGTLSTWGTDLDILSVDSGTDTFTSGVSDMILAAGPFSLEAVAFPGGTDGATPYWFIRDSSTTWRLALSPQAAVAGTAVNITSNGTGPMRLVRTLDTQVSGSTFLMVAALGNYTSSPSPPFDNKGNTYTALAGSPQTYATFAPAAVGCWVSIQGSGGPGHTFSKTYGGSGTGDEAFIVGMEIPGATVVKTAAHVEVPVGSATVTSNPVTVTGPAMLVFVICGNGPVNQDHTWIVHDGFTVLRSATAPADVDPAGYIQVTIATKEVPSGGIYTASASGVANEGGQLFLFGFQISEPTGSSGGTSTALAVGTAILAASGSIANTSSLSATGLGATTAVAFAGGVAVASATGRALSVATGTTGTESEASAIGSAVSQALALASSSSGMAGLAEAITRAQGDASGLSTATGSSRIVAGSIGTIAGVSTTESEGQSTSLATAQASGLSGTEAEARSTNRGVGTSVNAADVAAYTGNLTSSSALAVGAAAAQAVGRVLFAATGEAAGTSQAGAEGRQAGDGSQGFASGFAVVLGTGSSLVRAIGLASGTADLSAAGRALHPAVGSIGGTGSADAVGFGLAVGVGAAAGMSDLVAVSRVTAASDGQILSQSSVTGRGAALSRALGSIFGSSTLTATGRSGSRPSSPSVATGRMILKGAKASGRLFLPSKKSRGRIG